MRSGNLSSYLAGQGVTAIYQPDGVTPIDPANVPVSSISANLLQVLMPLPNLGSAGLVRQQLPDQLSFAHLVEPGRHSPRPNHLFPPNRLRALLLQESPGTTAPSATCVFTYCAEAGSPLQGAYNTPEIDEGLTFAHNFIFSSHLLNEFRGGYNAQHTSETQSYSTYAILSQTGLNVIQPDTDWSEAPQVLINGFMSTGAGNPARSAAKSFRRSTTSPGRMGITRSNSARTSSASPITTTTSSATIAPAGMSSTAHRMWARPSAIPTPHSCSAIPTTPKSAPPTTPP